MKLRRRSTLQAWAFIISVWLLPLFSLPWAEGGDNLPLVEVDIGPYNFEEEADSDLGIRFSKISFISADVENVYLDVNNYPVDGVLADMLIEHTLADTVITRSDFEVQGEDVHDYIQSIGGLPSQPSSDPQSQFWVEFRHVLMLQIRRRHNTARPSEFLTWPTLWQDMDLQQIAEAVHTDFPGTYQGNLLSSMFSDHELHIDRDVLPFRGPRNAGGVEVRLADLNTWAVGAVAPITYWIKWTVGRARPEEIAYKIASGNLTQGMGVPVDIIQKVSFLNLQKAEEFTQYEEGCPMHPSWPAIHAASSSMSLWLAVVGNLTEEQYCQVLRTDYAISYARIVAGVQYISDSIAGLNLGQEIIARKLPDHLAEQYGADPDVVRAKIASLRFDWRTFSPELCTFEVETSS